MKLYSPWIEAGVWSSDTTLRFAMGKDSDSRTLAPGEFSKPGESVVEVKVRCIDGCPECGEADIIKMDIEGSEMEALRGAEKLIRSRKPKLTICIYHSDEDMIRIAEWIHATVPEYKLWVRQHNCSHFETVIYAMT